MSDTTASLVWSTTPALAASLKTLPEDLIPLLINAAFTLPYAVLSNIYPHILSPDRSSQDLDAIRSLTNLESEPYDPSAPPRSSLFPPLVTSIQPSSLASFPLRLSHADSYLGLPKDGKDLRTVLVGDAAHTVHPLAGQGLNMGLGDVRSLVKTLERAVELGADVGSYTALRPYPRSRYIANHALLSATDHLASLYGSKNPLAVWARSTGLEMINELDSVKGLIMRQAGGIPETRGGRAGFWNGVAGALEGVGKGVESVKGAANLARNLLEQRLRNAREGHQRLALPVFLS